MFENLRRRVHDVGVIRTLCEEAESQAAAEGLANPGAEHFMLAALKLPDGTAERAFVRVGADRAELTDAIRRQYEAALRDVGFPAGPAVATRPGPPMMANTPYRASPSGQEVMRALAEARRGAGARPLVGAHVIAVVAGLEHGVAARALRLLGVDRAALRLSALAEAGDLPPGGPERAPTPLAS